MRRVLVFATLLTGLNILPVAGQRTEVLVQTIRYTPPSGLPHEMVFVPAGYFFMGSDAGEADEAPVHRVWMNQFHIDRYEVSNAHFKAFFDTEEVFVYSEDRHPPREPVGRVTWGMADAYCRAMGLRLPTEAEWEYAARGKDQRTYPWGNDAPTTARATWLNNSGEKVDVDALSAGTSPFGALNMAGNVSEWVHDWYADDYYGSIANPVDPQGPRTGTEHVVRGGSLSDAVQALRSADRDAESGAYDDLGFRCAKDVVTWRE